MAEEIPSMIVAGGPDSPTPVDNDQMSLSSALTEHTDARSTVSLSSRIKKDKKKDKKKEKHLSRANSSRSITSSRTEKKKEKKSKRSSSVSSRRSHRDHNSLEKKSKKKSSKDVNNDETSVVSKSSKSERKPKRSSSKRNLMADTTASASTDDNGEHKPKRSLSRRNLMADSAEEDGGRKPKRSLSRRNLMADTAASASAPVEDEDERKPKRSLSKRNLMADTSDDDAEDTSVKSDPKLSSFMRKLMANMDEQPSNKSDAKSVSKRSLSSRNLMANMDADEDDDDDASERSDRRSKTKRSSSTRQLLRSGDDNAAEDDDDASRVKSRSKSRSQSRSKSRSISRSQSRSRGQSMSKRSPSPRNLLGRTESEHTKSSHKKEKSSKHSRQHKNHDPLDNCMVLPDMDAKDDPKKSRRDEHVRVVVSRTPSEGGRERLTVSHSNDIKGLQAMQQVASSHKLNHGEEQTQTTADMTTHSYETRGSQPTRQQSSNSNSNPLETPDNPYGYGDDSANPYGYGPQGGDEPPKNDEPEMFVSGKSFKDQVAKRRQSLSGYGGGYGGGGSDHDTRGRQGRMSKRSSLSMFGSSFSAPDNQDLLQTDSNHGGRRRRQHSSSKYKNGGSGGENNHNTNGTSTSHNNNDDDDDGKDENAEYNPFVKKEDIQVKPEIEGNPFVDEPAQQYEAPKNNQPVTVKQDVHVAVATSGMEMTMNERLLAGEEIANEEALMLTVIKMKQRIEVMNDEKDENERKIKELEELVEAKEAKITALEYAFKKMTEGNSFNNKNSNNKDSKSLPVWLAPVRRRSLAAGTVKPPKPKPANFFSRIIVQPDELDKLDDSSRLEDDFEHDVEAPPPRSTMSFQKAGAKMRRAKADAAALAGDEFY